MTAREKNIKRCKEYYQRTKDNLTDAQKERRRETARIAQKRFYLKNKDVCIERNSRCRKERTKNKILLPKASIAKDKISIQRVIELKEINFSTYICKFKRMKIWDKKLIDWTNEDYNKFKKLKL